MEQPGSRGAPRRGVLTLLLWAMVLAPSSEARAGFIDHFATAADVGLDKAPHLGPSRVLVLPVVVDEPGLPSRAQLEAAISTFFDPAGVGFTFSAFFAQASLGRFAPLPVVAPTVEFAECPFAVGSNGLCTIRRGDLSSLSEAVVALREVLARADDSVDFSQFDVSGMDGVPDGVIDGFILVSNIDFGGIALPLLRLCDFNPASCGGASWDASYDGTLVPWVAVAGARRGDVETAARLTVHEFGHLLGFADLYDEIGETTDLPYSTMGGWAYGPPVPLLDAFSRYVIGWGNPVQVGHSGDYELLTAATTGDLLKLGTGKEYFLAELRAPYGPWDADIIPGVVVYHVNLERLPSADPLSFLSTLLTCVNCSAWDPLLMVEPADGQFELQLRRDARDDAGDLFKPGNAFPSAQDGAPLSETNKVLDSNTYEGRATGIAITAFTEIPGGYRLSVEHPPLADACVDLLCPAGTECAHGVCSVPVEEGCSCATSSRDMVACLAAFALLRRRRRAMSHGY